MEVGANLDPGPPKTNGSIRDVTLPRSVAKELAAHLDAYVADDPKALVFRGPKGGLLRRAGFRRCWWVPAVEAAQLRGLRVHDLRHTFVAIWVDAGRNIKEVSVAAGHSSVAFTLDRYGHLYERDDDDLQDRLDALLTEGTAPLRAISEVVELPRPKEIEV